MVQVETIMPESEEVHLVQTERMVVVEAAVVTVETAEMEQNGIAPMGQVVEAAVVEVVVRLLEEMVVHTAVVAEEMIIVTLEEERAAKVL
jgi:hypothetical protein